ncbi:MAG: HAMP domain-containing protein, partial [Bdellovibrionaceae bacterium]|nr:HAMP domain-containing protein [Pseudobdellovibrionaceae bacterium]
MREIERGDLGRRVVVGEAQDELQDMAQTYKRMIARIE